jgi:alkyl hydroperoxide reductase subunit AhpC
VPELSSRREQFAALNAQVMDISVDSIPSHIAWQKKDIGMIEIPLCADFYPHAEVTRKFGILRESAPVPGISERAAFVVNKDGKIVFSKVYPLDELPDVDEIVSVLTSLQSRAASGG